MDHPKVTRTTQRSIMDGPLGDPWISTLDSTVVPIKDKRYTTDISNMYHGTFCHYQQAMYRTYAVQSGVARSWHFPQLNNGVAAGFTSQRHGSYEILTGFPTHPSCLVSEVSSIFGLTMAWGIHIPSKVWNEITCPFQNFKSGAWEWICHFIPHFTKHVITYPWYELSSTMLVKVCIPQPRMTHFATVI